MISISANGFIFLLKLYLNSFIFYYWLTRHLTRSTAVPLAGSEAPQPSLTSGSESQSCGSCQKDRKTVTSQNLAVSVFHSRVGTPNPKCYIQTQMSVLSRFVVQRNHYCFNYYYYYLQLLFVLLLKKVFLWDIKHIKGQQFNEISEMHVEILRYRCIKHSIKRLYSLLRVFLCFLLIVELQGWQQTNSTGKRFNTQ